MTQKGSQSLVNEGRFPLFGFLNFRREVFLIISRNPSLMRAGFHKLTQELMRFSTSHVSQSLVNEGRFPQGLLQQRLVEFGGQYYVAIPR